MKAHIAYFDVLRVIAIFAVIILHVAVAHYNEINIFSFNWEMSNMWSSLVRWGVPVFVMISGALFLDPAREIDLHKLYSKNILHIGIILIFWSICYAGLGFLIGSSKGNIEKLITHTVLGNFHLWFLYMLLGLYIIIPLLRPICKDTKLIRYFLVLSIFFSFLVPTIIDILTGLDLIMPDSIFAKTLLVINQLLNDQIHFHFTVGYVAYFVLGYFLHKITLLPYQRKIIYILGILGGSFTIFFSRSISHIAQTPFNIYSNLTLNVLCESVAVFIFVKFHLNILPSKLLTIFNYLAKRVLGIYLIHTAVQSCLSKINISSTSFNPLISIPLIALLIFGLSWIGTEIIRKIPWLGKRII